MSAQYHIYADDGYEGCARSERAARSVARRGSLRRAGVVYTVVRCDAYGLSGGGHGHEVSRYFSGREQTAVLAERTDR